MSISVRFKYQVEDFKELLEVSQGTKMRRYRLMFLLLGVAVIAVPFVNGYTLGLGFLHPNKAPLPLVLLGVMLLIGRIATPQRKWLKTYEPHLDGEECEATFDDAGVVTTTPYTRHELKWEACSGTMRAPNVVALVLQSVMYAFPKRAFSDEQWAEFRNLVETRVKKP